MSMKINENTLRKIIRESIVKHINESANELDVYNGSFEDIIEKASMLADSYEKYAYQLRDGIKDAEGLYNEINQVINNLFNLNADARKSCSFSDGELEITFAIPVQNFLMGCRKNRGLLSDMEYDGKSSEEDMLDYGLNADWSEFFGVNQQHKIRFYAYKVVNNFVLCDVTITNILETWD